MTLLIVLAIIIIPVIINFYLLALELKLKGAKKVTVSDVVDHNRKWMFFVILPIGNILIMFILLICALYEIIKDFKLL